MEVSCCASNGTRVAGSSCGGGKRRGTNTSGTGTSTICSGRVHPLALAVFGLRGALWWFTSARAIATLIRAYLKYARRRRSLLRRAEPKPVAWSTGVSTTEAITERSRTEKETLEVRCLCGGCGGCGGCGADRVNDTHNARAAIFFFEKKKKKRVSASAPVPSAGLSSRFSLRL